MSLYELETLTLLIFNILLPLIWSMDGDVESVTLFGELNRIFGRGVLILDREDQCDCHCQCNEATGGHCIVVGIDLKIASLKI